MSSEKLAAAIQAKMVADYKKAQQQVALENKVRRDIRIKMQTINLFCEVKLIMLSPLQKAKLLEGGHYGTR